jgi:hypothetical protein
MQTQLRGVLTIVTAASLVACGSRPVAQISPQSAVSSRWNGAVSVPDELRGVVQGRGNAWLSPTDGGKKSRVGIALENMVPGGRHPLLLRSGQCGIPGATLAALDGGALRVNDEGKASVEATVDVSFPMTGDFMVAVLASSENASRVIACGNLAPPTSAMPR